MASLPSRYCSYPGCRNLRPCATHARQYHQARKTAERGYDAGHRKLRVLCFERDGWRCTHCGWEPLIVQQCRELGIDLPPKETILDYLRREYAAGHRHLHADHRIPVERRRDLRLDLGNYQTLCDACNERKARQGNPATLHTGEGG